MTDPAIARRLEMLSELLGQGVRLSEHIKIDNDQQNSDNVRKENHIPRSSETVEDPWSYGATWPSEAKVASKRMKAEEQAKERELASRKKKAFNCSDFQPGKPVGEDFEFCPLKVILTYHERFVGKTNRPLVKPFFERILHEKVWDFFYLHDPKEPARDPHLLVPTAQFALFLEEINHELGISLRIPGGNNIDKFHMKFGEGRTPRPRYLRRSLNDTSLDARPWPALPKEDKNKFEAATPPQQTQWREKMKIVKSGFTPKKDNSEKATMKKRHRNQMLVNTQAYLGLRASVDTQDVVFICVDVEAIERRPNPISEIGFAILDTKDIRGVEPGPCGENWRTSLRCHHLRVWEYAGLRNQQYVKGCPDAFDFGTSTFPRKADTHQAIMDVIDPYLQDSRKIAIVGHDIFSDIRYLSSLGVDLFILPNLLDHIDTQDMHQAWRASNQGRGLERVLSELRIISKNLHNAGNDAYYTLCAMVGIALEQIREEEEKKSRMHNEVD